MFILALALPAATLALTMPVAAQNPGEGRLLSRIDSNGDGAVNQAEIAAMRAEMFARLDANGDGYVTPEEGQQAKRRVRQRFTGSADSPLERADADGDGLEEVIHGLITPTRNGEVMR